MEKRALTQSGPRVRIKCVGTGALICEFYQRRFCLLVSEGVSVRERDDPSDSNAGSQNMATAKGREGRTVLCYFMVSETKCGSELKLKVCILSANPKIWGNHGESFSLAMVWEASGHTWVCLLRPKCCSLLSEVNKPSRYGRRNDTEGRSESPAGGSRIGKDDLYWKWHLLNC